MTSSRLAFCVLQRMTRLPFSEQHHIVSEHLLQLHNDASPHQYCYLRLWLHFSSSWATIKEFTSMVPPSIRQSESLGAEALQWFIAVIARQSRNRCMSIRIEFPQPDRTTRRFDVNTNSTKFYWLTISPQGVISYQVGQPLLTANNLDIPAMQVYSLSQTYRSVVTSP